MLNRYLLQRSISGASSATQLTSALDLSFIVKKFKNYSTDEYSTVDSDGMSVPPLACAFAKMYQWQHVVGVVDEDGYLVLYNTHKTGQGAVIKTWQVHANAVFDIEWLKEENKILTASGDQKIILHDIETREKLEIFKGHSSSVKAISCRSDDDAVFVTGSRDGHIMVWDKRISSKDGAIPPVCIISNAHMLQQSTAISKARKKAFTKDPQQSVTSVLFQNEYLVISSGAVDGCLKVWDIRKNYRTKQPKPVHTFHYPGNNPRKHGYSSLVLASNGLKLFANCTDDVIYEYDMAAYNATPVSTWRGHKNSTFYVKSALSADDQFLLSGSSDEHAYIWQINKPYMAPIVLKSHTAEVTSVAWCPNDITKLVTLSDDSKAKFWRIYCRDLKKKFHPQWYGKAESVSKERATCTYTDSPVQQLKPSLSQTVPPSIQRSHAPKSTTSSSPSSIINWLKRKSQPNSAETAEFSPPAKLVHKTSSVNSEPRNSVPELDKSPVSTKSCKLKRNFHEEFVELACPVTKKLKSEHCNDIGSFKVECSSGLMNAEGKFLCSIGEKSPSNQISSPKLKKSCSPCKKNNENNLPLSPEKILKRHAQDQQISSPKRPCLTYLNSNGSNSHLSNVRVSLFTDSPKFSDCANEHILDKTSVDDCSSRRCWEIKPEFSLEENSTDSSNSSTNFHTPSKEKVSIKPTEDSDFDSPTRNLPNLVLDQLVGRNVTPPPIKSKCLSPKLDWLTQLRLQKARFENEKSPKSITPSKAIMKTSQKNLK